MLDMPSYAPSAIVKSHAILFVLSILAIYAVEAATAAAQCSGAWDASGQRTISDKDSDRTLFTLDLQQSGSVLTGTATSTVWQTLLGRRIKFESNGIVMGTINSDRFSIKLLWAKTSYPEVYEATITPSGELKGETERKTPPYDSLSWRSRKNLTCASLPKPVSKTGRKPGSPDAAPTPNPPYLNAGPVIYPFPGAPSGNVAVSWDAGPDHPNAELTVSVNEQTEMPAYSSNYPVGHPVFKLPKAAVELTLPRRSGTYRYLLKSAGKTISSVTIVVP